MSRSELERINNQITFYAKKIHTERRRLEKINAQIAENEALILAQQQQQSQSRRGTENNAASIKRQIRSIENRLNQSLVAFNTKVASNIELRRKIDELRKERVRYDEIYTNLEQEVQVNTVEMSHLLEGGKRRIKMREKALDEAEAMRKQLRQASEALRVDKEEHTKLQQYFQQQRQDTASPKQHDEDNASRKNPLKAQKPDATCQDELYDDVEYDDERALDEAFAKLKELIPISDAEALVKKLTQIDELNFSRFNYITQELETSEILDHKIAEAQQELEMLRCSDMVVGVRMQQEAALKLEKRRELEQQIKKFDHQIDQKLNEWKSIKVSIETACSDLDVSLPCHLLSSDDGIAKNNVMEYLAAIESKATEIIEGMKADDDSECDSLASPSNLGKTSSSDSKELCVSLPTAEDFAQESMEDDGDRPLTIRELQSSLEK